MRRRLARGVGVGSGGCPPGRSGRPGRWRRPADSRRGGGGNAVLRRLGPVGRAGDAAPDPGMTGRSCAIALPRDGVPAQRRGTYTCRCHVGGPARRSPRRGPGPRSDAWRFSVGSPRRPRVRLRSLTTSQQGQAPHAAGPSAPGRRRPHRGPRAAARCGRREPGPDHLPDQEPGRRCPAASTRSRRVGRSPRRGRGRTSRRRRRSQCTKGRLGVVAMLRSSPPVSLGVRIASDRVLATSSGSRIFSPR